MMFEPGAVERSFGLEDYLRAARERWYVVVIVTLLTILFAGFLEAQRTDQYTATARVAVGPTPVGNAQRPNLEREREVIASNAIADAALEGLDVEVERSALVRRLTIQFIPDSEVLRISYSSTDPQVAADVANAVADAYVAKRETEADAFYRDEIESLNQQGSRLEIERVELEAQLVVIDEQRAEIIRLGADGDSGTLTVLAGERERISSDLAGVRAEERSLSGPLATAERERETRSPSAEVLGNATVPSTPDGLSRSIILFAAAIVGVMAGLASAFLLQRLDDTAKTDTQVELALGAKVLGSIPRFGRFGWFGRKSLVMLSTTGSGRMQSTREAYRRLATSVAFTGSSSQHRSILVTSYGPAEGKSTTTANLCIALAQSGRRVLLISADLRRPSLEERFGIALAPGLSEYLGKVAEPEAVPAPDIENLWLLPAGSPPANPGELLGSGVFAELLDHATESADFVIIDSPPVGTTADANAAAQHVDGVLVVVDSSRTATSDLLQVRADLERSGAVILGSVRNRTKPDRSFRRRNHYRYYGTATTKS